MTLTRETPPFLRHHKACKVPHWALYCALLPQTFQISVWVNFISFRICQISKLFTQNIQNIYSIWSFSFLHISWLKIIIFSIFSFLTFSMIFFWVANRRAEWNELSCSKLSQIIEGIWWATAYWTSNSSLYLWKEQEYKRVEELYPPLKMKNYFEVICLTPMLDQN